jgi:hypothetical protein
MSDGRYQRIPVKVVDESGEITDDGKDKVAVRQEHDDVKRQTLWPHMCNSPVVACYNYLCTSSPTCLEIQEEVMQLDMEFNGWFQSNEGRFARWLASERNSKNRDKIERGGTPPASSDTPGVTPGDSDSNPPPSSQESREGASSGWKGSHSPKHWR